MLTEEYWKINSQVQEIKEQIALKRGKLVNEDGSIDFGFGAELLSKLVERRNYLDFALRIGAESVPVPSIMGLELEILPTISRIIGLMSKL